MGLNCIFKPNADNEMRLDTEKKLSKCVNKNISSADKGSDIIFSQSLNMNSQIDSNENKCSQPSKLSQISAYLSLKNGLEVNNQQVS